MISGTPWNVILTDKALYKIEDTGGAAGGNVRRRLDLLDFHSIERDPTDPNAFVLWSYKSAAALAADKTKGIFGFGMDFDSFLQQRRFRCLTALECSEWVLVLTRLLMDSWQRVFEGSWKKDEASNSASAFEFYGIEFVFQYICFSDLLLTCKWQSTASVIRLPEIYQFHAFVIKLKKGVAQERTLVVSTEWIYNVEMLHNPTRVKEFKVINHPYFFL